MSEFIQLHILTSYPPSNLNRDDLGRPKTAVFGGSQRLRISSQSLKRAWRMSDHFATGDLVGHMGVRTRSMGEAIYNHLVEKGTDAKAADAFAKRVAGVFGKVDEKAKTEKDGRKLKQLAHFSAEEQRRIDALAGRFSSGETISDEEVADLLTDGKGSIDIALFGRMLADDPARNIDAAAQVAHAITVHKVAIEDDYFTAVDDLNTHEEDAGAGHIGVTEFGAGLFYIYICVNRTTLVQSVGDEALADRAIEALCRAATTTGPSGKVNSFGSFAYASYVLAEIGDAQPRNLSVAFLEDVRGAFLDGAIDALEKTRERFERAYGPQSRSSYTLNVPAGQGTLDGLARFLVERR